jgi:hypothetical protein
VQAHILVCFLAYVLWKTLEAQCRQAGLGDEPRQVFRELSEIALVDVVLPRATESLCENAVSASPISINSCFSNASASSCPPSQKSHSCSGNSTLLALTAKDLLIKLRKSG